MPNKPMMPDGVNGTCALKTEVSAIHIFWAGFNLTFEFVKNPEGNSYYMNRVILIYDTEHPSLKGDFEYANTHGKIHLETRPGKNFFFTPLGKAYLCYKAKNQVRTKNNLELGNELDSGPVEVVERGQEPDRGRDLLERHQVPAFCCASPRTVGRNEALPSS